MTNTTTPDLPKMCAVTLAGEPVIIVRGETRRHPIPAGLTVEEVNRFFRATPQQCGAMAAASLLGWDGPEADPANYDAEGKRRHA